MLQVVTASYTYIHTYIISRYDSSVKMTAYLLTPLTLCALILYVSGGTYSLTSTPNDRILRKIFHGKFIYSQNVCQKSAESKSPKKYFILIPDLGYDFGLYV